MRKIRLYWVPEVRPIDPFLLKKQEARDALERDLESRMKNSHADICKNLKRLAWEACEAYYKTSRRAFAHGVRSYSNPALPFREWAQAREKLGPMDYRAIPVPITTGERLAYDLLMICLYRSPLFFEELSWREMSLSLDDFCLLINDLKKFMDIVANHAIQAAFASIWHIDFKRMTFAFKNVIHDAKENGLSHSHMCLLNLFVTTDAPIVTNEMIMDCLWPDESRMQAMHSGESARILEAERKKVATPISILRAGLRKALDLGMIDPIPRYKCEGWKLCEQLRS